MTTGSRPPFPVPPPPLGASEAAPVVDDPSDLGPPPWPALLEDERPPDSEPTRVRAPSVRAPAPVATSRAPVPPAEESVDFARRTAELEIAEVARAPVPRPVLPFVPGASPLAAASMVPLHAPPEEGDFTDDVDVRVLLAADRQHAKPVLPFRAAASQGAATSGHAPVLHPMHFPPAPPLGLTPGRFVTVAAPAPPAPPAPPVVPRAPTFGGPPPSSPGAAIPKLPPIPGKPVRGG